MPDSFATNGAVAPPQTSQSLEGQRSSSQTPWRPLFVVGCERSGTTLLTVMLGRHRDIAMMPETHFFLRVVPKRFNSVLKTPSFVAEKTISVTKTDVLGTKKCGSEMHEEILQRFWESPRAADICLDAEAIRARFAADAPTYPNLFRTLLELYAERWGKRLAGEKTPFHLLRVPLILQWFPDARIVCIVRDGRDVVRSILNAPWTAHRSLRRHAWKWTRCARLARQFLHDYPRQFQVVRYEDLVQEPEMVLRRVNAFFRVDFDAAQLDTGGPSPVVPAHERSWKANAVDRPDESRISAWRQHVSTEERLVMNSMMGAELRTFGYADTELPAASAARRVQNAMLNTLCKAGIYRIVGNIRRYFPEQRKHRRAGGEQALDAATSWEEDAAGMDSGFTHTAA